MFDIVFLPQRLLLTILVGTGIWLPFSAAAADENYRLQRETMIDLIEADVRATSAYLKRSALDDRVLDAMARVPRHEFVPAARVDDAYENRPLPIGHGQTISQPYIVAIMTDLLDLDAGQTVLEIGTGSGYQAAVLAALDLRVWSIELVGNTVAVPTRSPPKPTKRSFIATPAIATAIPIAIKTAHDAR